jgi:chromosome segregation ATPase
MKCCAWLQGAATVDLSEELEAERGRGRALEEELAALRDDSQARISQAAGASRQAQEELLAVRAALTQAESSREELQAHLLTLQVGHTVALNCRLMQRAPGNLLPVVIALAIFRGRCTH